VDKDLRVTEWNLRMEQMCGTSREQIIGRHLDEVPALKETGEVTRVRLALEGRSIGVREFGYRLPGTDKESFFESLMAPLLGPAGQILGVVLRVRDITARKQTQQTLSDSEALFRTLFDSVQDGVILAEAQSRRFLMVNSSMCRMLGYSADELLKIGVDGIHPEESLPYVVSQFERLASGVIGVAADLPIRRKDGSVFYADANAGPMMLNGVACLVGVFRDITERKQAQQALMESESMLRTVFDTVENGILLADAQTYQFRMANNAMCRMLGYSREELLELEIKDIHPEKDLPNVVGQLERQLKGEVRLAPNLPVKRKNGTIFYADVNVVPMQVKAAAYILGVFRDTTERKRAEEAEELASRDGLTGLYNHRTFYLLLKDEIVRSQRFKRPVSLLMFDIDHFKRVNDTHGHQTGDAILKGLSDLLLNHARAVDRMCRYGGEEFSAILPETDTAEAMQIAERLRAAVECQPFDIGGGKTININVSIGVATYPQQVNTLEAFVKAADVALFAAKQGGRNRVCRYETEMAA
jgi:diguanylate cyclase (GGDEF)-like protein/PAS domain S-box-containing protein